MKTACIKCTKSIISIIRIESITKVNSFCGVKLLALYNRDRPKLDNLLTNPRIVTRVNNLRNVLITLRRFLHNQLRARNSNTNPLFIKVIKYVSVTELPAGFSAGLSAACAVAGAAECFVHAFLSSGEDVRAGSHGASDEDGLACELVVHGDERVVGGERAGGALSVDEEGAELVIDDVLFDLRDVMRHIVDYVHVEVVWGA